MKPITVDEIMQLYKKCGLNCYQQHGVRTEINTGTLNNRLNANYEFLNKSLSTISESNYYIEKNNKFGLFMD